MWRTAVLWGLTVAVAATPARSQDAQQPAAQEKKVIGGIEKQPSPDAPKRIRVGGQVQEAKLVHKVAPVYPLLAKQAGIQGTVRVQLILDKEGVVKEVSVLSGHPLLVQAALDAVRQWRYQPTLLCARGCLPISTWISSPTGSSKRFEPT